MDRTEYKIEAYQRIGRWGFGIALSSVLMMLVCVVVIFSSQFWRVTVQDGSLFACFLPW